MPSKIEWCDETWNPVTGCTKISPACDNCYAERMSHRMAGRFGYPRDEPFRVTMHPDKLAQPMRWKKPRRIFVVSMGDLFHEDVPDDYIASIFSTMALRPQHTFMVLTKRPRRMKVWMEWAVNAPHDLAPIRDTWPIPNVWLGVTAEDQQRADERIPVLAQIPAAKRFLSCEPMLGPIDLRQHLRCELCGYSRMDQDINWDHHLCSASFVMPNWVIVGGESGPGARPTHPDWVHSLRVQCTETGVPFFFKGWGEWLPHGQVGTQTGVWGNADRRPLRTTKKNAGRLLDGVTWDEMPERGEP